MNARPSILFAAMMIAASAPYVAYAGEVDIQPDRYAPRVVIGAEREVKHDATPRRANNPAWPPGQYTCTRNASTDLYECELERVPARDLEDEIVRAVREMGLPSLEVQIQPGTSTLVNVPTIFYAEPEAFNRSVTLLGFDVDLIATPVRYRWLHGDGTASTTSKPGRPYPSTDVTYRYRQPAEAVSPRVDVTYRVRYRVDGGSWNTIDQTLLASGPTAELEVKEAAPVLTHP